MRYFPAFLAVVVLGFAPVAFSQTAPAPAAPKVLPGNIKTELETALAKVNKNNGKALAKVTVKFAKKYSSFVPEIGADAVAFVADALKNDPATAKVVIPQIVAALTKANPSLTGAIVAASLRALPPDLRNTLVVDIAKAVIDAVPEKREKAAALNAALLAVGDNQTLLTELDKIAQENKIGITQVTQNETTSERYFVDEDSDQTSGDQGVLTQGQTTDFNGAGGGNGAQNTASGTQPSPTPSPTPNPTPRSL